jgi:hypothetical protein
MLKFVVTKNGGFVGKPFDSREEAKQIAELEKLGDPSADVRVQPVLTMEEGLDPTEGGENSYAQAEALVDAILDGEDFSDFPPEHLGPMVSSDEGQGEAAPDAVSEQDVPGQGEKSTKHDKSKAMPVKAISFFVRHPSIPVEDEDLEKLWAQDKVAVHLPGVSGDTEGPNPSNHQKPSEKTTSMYFEDLAKKGGYVWAETRVKSGVAKVGRVSPQEPEPFRAVWAASKNPKYAGKTGSEVILKTLRLEDVKEVAPDEAVSLRAERPLGEAMRPWTGCGSRLKALIEGSLVEHTWGNLTPRQQLAVSAEFLRLQQKPGYPKLKFLLTPAGITKNVDVYGMEDDGAAVYAQITSHRKGSSWVKWKVEKLKEFDRPGNRLVCFCRISSLDGGDTLSLFPPGPDQEDGVLFIPVEEVLRWVKEQPAYAERLFSA